MQAWDRIIVMGPTVRLNLGHGGDDASLRGGGDPELGLGRGSVIAG